MKIKVTYAIINKEDFSIFFDFPEKEMAERFMKAMAIKYPDVYNLFMKYVYIVYNVIYNGEIVQHFFNKNEAISHLLELKDKMNV